MPRFAFARRPLDDVQHRQTVGVGKGRPAKHRGKAMGFMASGVEEGRKLLEWGVRCVAYGGDIHLYRTALGEGITSLRQASAAPAD